MRPTLIPLRGGKGKTSGREKVELDSGQWGERESAEDKRIYSSQTGARQARMYKISLAYGLDAKDPQEKKGVRHKFRRPAPHKNEISLTG